MYERATILRSINVHSGAGAHKPIVETLKRGDHVNIYDTKFVGAYEWWKIAADRWIYGSAQNAKRDVPAPPAPAPAPVKQKPKADKDRDFWLAVLVCVVIAVVVGAILAWR